MENFHEMTEIIGALFGFIANIILAVFIIRKPEGYSFASFGLWSILDFLSARSLFLQGENYTLALVWACCAAFIALLLLIKRQINWSWVETMTIFLIGGCFMIWGIYGLRVAFLATLFSLVIASTPQIRVSYLTPNRDAGLVYGIFTLSAFISIFSEEEISFAGLAFPATAFLICGVITVLSYGIKTSKLKTL